MARRTTDTRPRWRTTPSWIVLTLSIVLCWIWVAPWSASLNNPNENVRIYATRAWVEHGTWAIDEVVEDWGYVNDKATRNGLLYAGKAPGTSMMAVPGLALNHAWHQWRGTTASRQEIVLVCRWSASILPTLVFLFAFGRFTRTVTAAPGPRMTAIVALALGSTILPYGLICASHSVVAAFVFGGFMLAWRHVDEPDAWWIPIGSGFLWMASIACEYPALLGVLVVASWSTLRSPARLRWIAGNLLGALVPLALLMAYHDACFGSPFAAPYSFLENPEFIEHHNDGFFGMERIQPRALYGSFLHPGNGLFWFVPWSIVAIGGLFAAIRDRSLREPALITFGVLLVYTVFVSMVHNWRGGWTAGPRYIVPVVPFLAWYLLHLLRASRGRGLEPFVVVTTLIGLALGVFACGISAVTFPHFPEESINPIHEISVFFLHEGYAPWTILHATGLSGPVTLLPVALGFVVAWFTVIVAYRSWTPGERVSVAVLCTSVAITLGVLSRDVAHTDEPLAGLVRTTVMNVWEPRKTPVTRALHAARLPRGVIDTTDRERLLRAARDAAGEGFDQTAASLYRAALDAPTQRDAAASATAPPALEMPSQVPDRPDPVEPDVDDEDAGAAGDGGEEVPEP